MRNVLKQIKYVFELCFYALLCNFVPIKKNRIVFSCHNGKGTINCNPKYISLEILKQNLPYEIIWIIDKKININDKRFDKIKIIDNNNFFLKMLALMSSRVWIENSLKVKDYQKGLFKKKNQIYINTWHGSFGIKKMFYDTEGFNDKNIWGYFFKKEIAQIDYMLASSKWEEDIYKSGLKYKGEVLNFGNPRNDLFFEDKNEIRKKVLNYFKIDENKKILLYAPTFRDNKSFEISLEFSKIIENLKDKFKNDFIVLTRMHIEQKNKNKESSFIDATLYPDIQELLVASDVLISDYSSVMFDYMLLEKPCFVYAPDYNDFNKIRGLYYSLQETPFLFAKTNNELTSNILKFDIDIYRKKCIDFIKNKNVLNDGLSSKRVVEFIKESLQN